MIRKASRLHLEQCFPKWYPHHHQGAVRLPGDAKRPADGMILAPRPISWNNTLGACSVIGVRKVIYRLCDRFLVKVIHGAQEYCADH